MYITHTYYSNTCTTYNTKPCSLYFTYLSLFLGFHSFILRPSFETTRWIFVVPWFEQTVCKSLCSHFLSLNIYSHAWINIEDRSICSEWLPLWHQSGEYNTYMTSYTKLNYHNFVKINVDNISLSCRLE
jgi:hypothetical protein